MVIVIGFKNRNWVILGLYSSVLDLQFGVNENRFLIQKEEKLRFLVYHGPGFGYLEPTDSNITNWLVGYIGIYFAGKVFLQNVLLYLENGLDKVPWTDQLLSLLCFPAKKIDLRSVLAQRSVWICY